MESEPESTTPPAITPEDAKYYRDKYVIESNGQGLKGAIENKGWMNIDKSSIERYKREHPPKEEIHIVNARSKLAECYSLGREIHKRYVDIPEDYVKFITMWIISTYFQESFNTFPILFFNAMKGSGKTRELKLISALGSKGDGSVQNNLTEAVLFRIPRGTTTCIDEIEQIGGKEKQTLRELINSIYKKGMKVKRMKKVKKDGKEEQVVDVFEPYFPLAMANINGLDEVLSDRSITVIMEKSANIGITYKIEDFDTNPLILEFKRTLASISDVCDVTLRQKNYITAWNNYIDERYNNITSLTSYTSYTTITSETSQQPIRMEEIELEDFFNKMVESKITGRNFELLFPILIVAKLISNDVFKDILRIGSYIMNKKKEEEYSDSKDVSLFEYIYSKRSNGLDFLPVKQLTQEFRNFIGEDDMQDRWLNEKWMGRALKRLNLIIAKKKVSFGSLVILNYSKAHEKLQMFKTEESKEEEKK